MALRTLTVEGFRGIRHAELSLETTTVLIGENGSGRSTLLEALALVLSPLGGARPVVHAGQFHRVADANGGRAEGPMLIRLEFVESRTGSWDRPGLEALAPILGGPATRPRTLVLEVTATAPDREEAAVRWEVRSADGVASHDDLEVLAAVRRMNPLVWLREGALVDPAGSPVAAAEGASPAPARPDSLAVLQNIDRLLRGSSPLSPGGLEAEFAAAERLLAEWAPGARERGPQVREVVAEILSTSTKQVPLRAGPKAANRLTAGSAAQKLGVSLAMARLVRDLSRTASPGAHPILVVEDPEAHLHPMTLASVWGLLARLSTQKIVTTNSGTLLATVPLGSLRRIARGRDGTVREWRVRRGALRKEELRKVGYHLRTRRGVACFARCWLLVEGETEFWILPDLARLCGYDLAQEGVVCVEFAQCGLPPLVKLAESLGIEWHVLVDGDAAGESYAATLRPFFPDRERGRRLTQLQERDVEHCFWQHGHAQVFERLAGRRAGRSAQSVTHVIHKAIDNQSKPGIAFELLASAATSGGAGPPPPLREVIESCVRLARGTGAATEAAPARKRPIRYGRRPAPTRSRVASDAREG